MQACKSLPESDSGSKDAKSSCKCYQSPTFHTSEHYVLAASSIFGSNRRFGLYMVIAQVHSCLVRRCHCCSQHAHYPPFIMSQHSLFSVWAKWLDLFYPRPELAPPTALFDWRLLKLVTSRLFPLFTNVVCLQVALKLRLPEATPP